MNMRRSWREQLPLHLFVLPAFLIVAIYSYGPMVGIAIAFQNYIPGIPFFEQDWAGWGNFEYVWSLSDTRTVLVNTMIIACLKIVGNLIVPVVVALLLNEVRHALFKRVFQTVFYFPHFLSWVLLGGILIDILSPSTGLANRAITALGFESIYFLGDNRVFPGVLVVTDILKEFGFSAIVYMAALTGINPALYEAAIIDGAGRWKQTLYITIPGILPIVVLMTTLSLGNVLNAGFDQVFNLYTPQVYSSGDIIDTLVYRLGIEQAQFSVATAVGLMKSVVSFGLISVSYYLAYRFANYRIF